MGKIAPGAVLPTRNALDPFVADTENPPPPHYLEYILTRLTKNFDRIARWYSDQARLVEEYSGESYEGPTGETILTVIADYEPANERITSVLVTGPPNSPFTLQLGSRFMNLVTNASGICLLAPVEFTLTPQSKRLLTATTPAFTANPHGVSDANAAAVIVAATAGNVSLPNAFIGAFLEGFDISLSTVGTAPMTVTVSNVDNGPFTYTIPTGAQSLSIRYPAPLVASGGNATVSWNATASAVGNVTLYGESAITTPGSPAPASWFFQLSGYALSNIRGKN